MRQTESNSVREIWEKSDNFLLHLKNPAASAGLFLSGYSTI